MELLVDSARPRPLVEALLLVVREAIELAVPGLHCALAVPARDGGRWVDGAALHEAGADVELVMVEWLKERTQKGSVAVGLMPTMTGDRALEHYNLWLSPVLLLFSVPVVLITVRQYLGTEMLTP